MRPIDWRRSPYSSGVIQAQLLRAGLLHPRFNRQRPVVSPNLTCSPAPCVFPNSQASGGGQPVNETPIAINPRNSQQILTGGNDYNCSSLQGYYLSSDGGSTWTRTCGTLISGSTGGDGDPAVAWDLRNTAYRGGIDALSGNTSVIVVDHSSNGGSTWSTPVAAAPVFFSGGFADKEWMEIDTNGASPRKNNIYLSVTQFDPSSNSQITVSHSYDHGSTWAMVAVGGFAAFPVVNQFSDLVVGKDGTVYVTWMRCTANGPTNDCGGTVATMLISKSTDGGMTWSAETTVGTANLAPDSCGAFYGCLPNTGERLSNIPANAIDNSNNLSAGTLYVVDFTYVGYTKVQVTSSSNGGATWSTPVRVTPRSDHHDQFFPWINVNRAGVIGVTWMDRRNDPSNLLYEEFGGYSKTGAHYTNFQLSPTASNPNNDGFGGGFMGDYSGNAWTGNSLYASWTDTSNGVDAQDVIGGVLK
jgi:hypothetical protein